MPCPRECHAQTLTQVLEGLVFEALDFGLADTQLFRRFGERENGLAAIPALQNQLFMVVKAGQFTMDPAVVLAGWSRVFGRDDVAEVAVAIGAAELLIER